MAGGEHDDGYVRHRAARRANELRNGIPVGAALGPVVTLSFQAAATGGFWQDDLVVVAPAPDPNDVLQQRNHTAGDPIWRDKYPSEFKRFRNVKTGF
ncbi:hypothetical protein ACLOJK_039491 [Asimina triloba]